MASQKTNEILRRSFQAGIDALKAERDALDTTIALLERKMLELDSGTGKAK